MMMENIPKTVEDMRNLLNGFAGMLSGDMAEAGAFHEKWQSSRVESPPY